MNILILSDNGLILDKIKKIFEKNKTDLFNYKIVTSQDINFDELNYDLIISAHCKTIFPAHVVKKIRCINIHPGYNPINRGWYPHVFSIAKNNVAGATIHEMDEKVDHGPIIAREEVKITSTDDSYSLYQKIIECEAKLFDKFFFEIINNTYKKFIPDENEISSYNSKNEFEKLRNLDLKNVDTLENHINLLRSLSHQDYNNAYFEDKNGNKVYVSLNLRNL